MLQAQPIRTGNNPAFPVSPEHSLTRRVPPEGIPCGLASTRRVRFASDGEGALDPSILPDGNRPDDDGHADGSHSAVVMALATPVGPPWERERPPLDGIQCTGSMLR